jgi:hypothetical protein
VQTKTKDSAESSVNEISKSMEDMGAIASSSMGNSSVLTDSKRQELFDYISRPKDVKTPTEKIKLRPDGFDYVESSWMDYQSKMFMPLYEYKLLHTSIDFGWVNVIVSLTDKITGNVELGADSARIMVKRDADSPTYRDILDMGNNLKSALSKAIKNAQSRFGVAADVYRKIESEPTQDERERYKQVLQAVNTISPTRSQVFKDQWVGLGTDWSQFLDKWQVYIDRNKPK